MKYCPECGTEYRDDAVRCSDDDAALVTADQLPKGAPPAPGERDTRSFVRIGTAEDPLSADQLVAALFQARISAFARPRRGGSVDGLTTGSSSAWWEIVAPEELAVKAKEIVDREREAMDASSEEAARAAEEEEAESERSGTKETP
jgi:hypothetical protein